LVALSEKIVVTKVRSMAKRAAIILSGGRSERFQRAKATWQDKALVEFHGKPLLVHAIENVSEVVDEVVICINNDKRKVQYSKVLKKHNIKNARLVIDKQSNHLGGPIVGILTGLLVIKADYCFSLPSDMPLLQSKVIDHMFNSIEDARVVVPMWPNGRLETLNMILKKPDVLEIAKTLCQLRRPRSDDIIRGALNVLLISIVSELKALDPKLKSFININSPADLTRLQPRQAQGPVAENLRLNLGDLPIPELLSLQHASELLNKNQFLEASKAFSSCATKLETECSYFWAAISRENEAKSLLNFSKQQNEQQLATEQACRSNENLIKAINNYDLEAKIYEKAHAIFLAERAMSNKEWCLSQQRILKMSGF
jgi:molybdopterin-guanine dinucleotide biosynthesis protein A